MKTNQTNQNSKFIRKFILLSSCLLLPLLARNAAAQATVYWDNNGSGTPGSGTWDTASPNWSTTSALTASPTTFTTGSIPVFCAGTSAAGSITVAVETAISANGVYNNGIGGTPCALTLTSQTGNGSLSLPAGMNTFFVTSAASNTTVNIPINGSGGLQTGGAGTLYLYGANGYTGGTTLASAALVYFNNGSAFGSGAITPANGGFAALLSAGGYYYAPQ